MRIRLLTYNLAVMTVAGVMSASAQEPQQTQPQSANANQAITITGGRPEPSAEIYRQESGGAKTS